MTSSITFPRSQLADLIRTGIAHFDYEALLERHYRRWIQPGDTVVDIGAHSGRHLASMLDCVGSSGKAMAFEPLPEQFAFLQTRFPVPQVQLENVALSDEPGVADFTFARGTPEESGLKSRIFNSSAADPVTIEVKVATLDDYMDSLDGLSFVKIDVEGAEMDCLRGGATVLQRFRPLVSIEYGYSTYSVYGNTKWTLFDFAAEHDYVLYDVFSNRLKNRASWSDAVDSIYWDFFMVPKEHEVVFLQRIVTDRGMAASIWPSIQELRFSSDDQPAYRFLDGWSNPETWGTWSEGYEAGLAIDLVEYPTRDLDVVIYAHGFVTPEHPNMVVDVLVNSHMVGRLDFANLGEPMEFRVRVPMAYLTERSMDLRFVVPEPHSPQESGLSEDTRLLGIGLRKMSFVEVYGA